MSKASSTMTLASPHGGDPSSRTPVKKLQSNTSISGEEKKPRVIIGRESLLHYEPNKPMLGGGSFTQRGKKGSS